MVKLWFVSIDVETDGPIPGPHSMRQLGASAFSTEGVIFARFIRNLSPLPGATIHPQTAEWWKQFPDKWAEMQKNQISPKDCMEDFLSWLNRVRYKNQRVTLVANPAAFDGMFVNWYGIYAKGDFESLPWKHRVLDIRTYLNAMMKEFNYHKGGYKDMRDFGGILESDIPEHNHNALQDSEGQGIHFANMALANMGLKK